MASFSFEDATQGAPSTGNTFSFEDVAQSDAPSQPSQLMHALARTGRDVVGGMAGLGDIGYAAVAPIYQAERKYIGEPIAKAMGVEDYMGAPQDTSKMQPSIAAKAAYDKLTDNVGQPQNKTEAAVDKATEFLTQATIGAPLAGMVTQGAETATPTATSLLGKVAEGFTTPISASKALASTAPQTLGEGLSVAGAGAGSEVAHQAFPNSNIAPVLGAIAGGVSVPGASSLSSGAKEMIAPEASAVVKPIAEKALEYGIPLTRSQIGDSRFNQGVASVAEKMPLTGGVQFRNAQQSAFNRAIATTIGENADKITPEVINNAYKNIGDKFNKVHSGLQVKVDDKIITQLSAIEEDAKNSITHEHFKIVENNINKFLGDVDKDGIIPGEKLNSLRANLAKTLKSTRNDASPYLGDIHDLVMNAATADNPSTQQMLNEARLQYKNLKTIEPLAAKADRGNINPSLLTNAVRQKYRDFTRGGGGKLGDLARIGNTFLKDKIPNSGTPERQMLINTLEGAAAIGTGIASPMTAVTGAGTLGLARGFNKFNQSQSGVLGALNQPSVVRTQNYTPGLMGALLKPSGN